MTQQILNLTHRFVEFEKQLQHFDEEAKQIASGASSKTQINMTELAYDDVHAEAQNLRGEIDKIANVGMNAFIKAVTAQFEGLMKRYNDLTAKFETSVTLNKNHSELHGFFEKFVELGINKNTREMDELKMRNLEIVDSGVLTPTTLEMAANLENNIVIYQTSRTSESLRQIHHLINKIIKYPEEHREQFYQSIREVFIKLSLYEMGLEVKKEIFKSAKDKIGVSTQDIRDFNEVNSLSKLAEIISEHPLYTADVMEPEVLSESSSEDESGLSSSGEESDTEMPTSIESQQPENDLSSNEIDPDNNHASETPQQEQAEDNLPILDIGWGGSMIEVPKANEESTTKVSVDNLGYVKVEIAPQRAGMETSIGASKKDPDEQKSSGLVQFSINSKILPLDLQEFASLVRQLKNNADLPKEACTAAINRLRDDLPREIRWSLDGWVYKLSKDPHKGGENWGEKNAAKDPDLLLDAIDAEMNKQIS